MRIAVIGAGLVGRRAAAVLVDRGHEVVLTGMTRTPPALAGAEVMVGWAGAAGLNGAEVDLAVLATESSRQPRLARRLLEQGCPVVSTADSPRDVAELMDCDELARRKNVPLVVGVAYSPGLSTVIATLLAAQFDEVFSIATARFGTGGPACARQHHRSLQTPATHVRDGGLMPVSAGSSRQLIWFPDPAGPADCYQAASIEPLLLHRAFPNVDRIECRRAATRRDRLTGRLPMLRPPHPEGLIGAVWVEVRGRSEGQVHHRALAATAPQATGAAIMAAAMAEWVGNRQFVDAVSVLGTAERGMVFSPASVRKPGSFLGTMPKGVRLWNYDGSQKPAFAADQGPINAARKWRGGPKIVGIATISF